MDNTSLMNSERLSENFSQYTSKAYLEYAMMTITGRAIPAISDGLKPVHRRILWAMYKMGITATGSHTKSARITGEVIGKYHPHGDAAVYEAMVNLTQDFRHRYPLIEGQGNFGTRDKDLYAAARYTEARFQSFAKILYDELDEDAVTLIPNYDGKEVHPSNMPARLPLVLLNYSDGVAVGFATKIPSHNMREIGEAAIYCLSDKNPSLEGVLERVKGPDFPTGAALISKQEDIEKAYREGRGAFRLRGKYFIENSGSKNWKIVFTELPYVTSVKEVLEQIQARMNPEINAQKDSKGKPKISDEDTRIKQLFNNLIFDFKDESDRENPLRLVITPKVLKRKEDELVGEITELLFGYTDIEANFNANFVVIGLDGSVAQRSLLEILQQWCQFRIDTVRRRCEFHLNKIKARKHILEGREIVFDRLEEVINIIRKSENALSDLMSKIGLSDIQANDVLEMRLRQLSNLELNSIKKEYSEKIEKERELSAILETEGSLKRQIIKEIKADVKTYGDDRRTSLEPQEKIDISKLQQKTIKIAEEAVTLAISDKGWVKLLRGRKNEGDITLKDGDTLKERIDCKSTDYLGFIDNSGVAYSVPLISLGKDALPIVSLADVGAKVDVVYSVSDKNKYLILQDTGFGFIASGDNLIVRAKKGKAFVTMSSDTAKLFSPQPYGEGENTQNWLVAMISTDNKALIFKFSEIGEIAKGKGITLFGGMGEDRRIKDFKIIKDGKVSFVTNGVKGGQEILEIEGENLTKLIKSRTSKGFTLSFNKIKDRPVNFLVDTSAGIN